MQKSKLRIRNKKESGRLKRHRRIRKKIFGTTEVPRLCVHRSLKNIEAQLIDDMKEKTILSLSTNSKEFKEKLSYGGNVKAAFLLGEIFAKKAKKKGIKKVVFDRGGYLYHGRIKTFADAVRKGGLIF